MIKIPLLSVYGVLIILLLSSLTGLAQSRRVIGVIPFHNQSNSDADWMSYGINEMIHNYISRIKSISIYEKETLRRTLKRLDIQISRPLNTRKTFSIGKATEIAFFFTGDYKVTADQLSLNCQLMSTFTRSAVYRESFEGKIEEIFHFLPGFIKKGLDAVKIPLNLSEKKKLTRTFTASIESFKLYGKAYIELDKTSGKETAIALLQQALQLDPQFWKAQYDLGIIYYNAHQYNKAFRQFEELSQTRNHLYHPFFGKGILSLSQKRYYQALEQLNISLKRNPLHDRSYYYKGIVYTHLDSIKKAITAFQSSIQLNPNYTPAHYQLGLTQLKRGWLRKAAATLSKATELDPEHYLAHNALGETYYALNTHEEAIIEFKKAIKFKPTYATAYFNLGNALHKKGALSEIVDSFWSLIENQHLSQIGSYSDSSSNDLRQLRERSRIKDPSRTLREMINAFKTAIKYDQHFFEASYNLAMAYDELGKADSAEIFYKYTLSQKPDLAKVHMRLGKLYDSQQRYDLAIQAFKKVVELEPDYFIGNPRLGEPYRYINIVESVLHEHQSYLEKASDNTESLKIIGNIHLHSGKLEQAEQYFQRLANLTPKDMAVQQILHQIRGRQKEIHQKESAP